MDDDESFPISISDANFPLQREWTFTNEFKELLTQLNAPKGNFGFDFFPEF